MAKGSIGTVAQVIGPVLDIKFNDGELPQLLSAIEVDNGSGKKLVVEVAQHIGDDVVRCIAMSSTDGLTRGAKATDTGSSITVPVGEKCLGRISTCWAIRLTISPLQKMWSAGRFTAKPRLMTNRKRLPRFLKQASRSST